MAAPEAGAEFTLKIILDFESPTEVAIRLDV